MNIDFKKLTEFTFGAQLGTEEEAIEFALNYKLISYEAINCNICNSTMRLEKKSVNNLLSNYRCTDSRCRNFISITTNTWFYGVNAKWLTILQIMFMWCEGRNINEVTRVLSISNKTAIKWYNFCREVCAIILSNQTQKIGGQGFTVEIDETHLFTRKYHKGRLLKGQKMWIFGGICRETNDVFLVSVIQRNVDTLLPIILKFVKDGTTIYTDCWKSYNKLNEHKTYSHETVNHKKEFVRKVGNCVISTQKVERMWRDMKSFIPKVTSSKYLESYLLQYVYFRKFKRDTVGERFLTFVEHIRLVYPGPLKEGLKLIEF